MNKFWTIDGLVVEDLNETYFSFPSIYFFKLFCSKTSQSVNMEYAFVVCQLIAVGWPVVSPETPYRFLNKNNVVVKYGLVE